MKQLPLKERFSRFIEPIIDYKLDYFIHFLQSVFRSFSTIIHIFFVEKIVYSLSLSDIDLFKKTIIFYIIVFLSFEIIWYLTRKVWRVKNIPNTRYFLFKKYLSKLISMKSQDYEKIWTGKMISIINDGTNIWSEWITNIVEKWAMILVLIIYTLFKVWSESIIFLFLTIIMLFLGIFLMWYINKLLFKYRNRRTDIRNNITSNIVKIIMSKYEIMQTSKLDYEMKKLSFFTKENVDINIEMSIWRFFQNRAVVISISFILIFICYFYWLKVLSWDFSISEFTAITTILLVISWTIYQFISFYTNFTKEFISVEKLWDLYDNVWYMESYDKWDKFEYKKWDISIKNLSYWYNKKDKVIEDFSINIKWWEKIAFVWHSWSWKTTIVKLIAWYLQSNSWIIKIDNQNINDLSLKSYYKHIGYLTQEPSIFDWTIKENLIYAIDYLPSEEEIKEVLEKSNCNFVFDLENSVDTEIWEKGIRLSWWQRQRLAIAKIMLKNPEIIILDEPTSALDSFSEEQITKAMNNLFKNRTVIVIAHRLQTVKKADNIYVIENWRIVEKWNHKELIKNKWIYYDMLELQSGF